MNAINQLLNTLENYGSITGTNIVKIQTLQKNYTIKDECYLVQKDQQSKQYFFFENIRILPWWNYEYDNDENLKIMRNNKEVIEIIPKENYLSFLNDNDAITSSQVIIPFPLPEPLSISDLITKYLTDHIIRTFITAAVPIEILEKITIKNNDAIPYPASNEQLNLVQQINESK